MSRAFVKEDDHQDEPEYRLPDPESPYYDEAAAWALIQGADEGDTKSAELATGYRWGDVNMAFNPSGSCSPTGHPPLRSASLPLRP